MNSTATASRAEAQFVPVAFVPLTITLNTAFPFAANEVWIAVFGQLNHVIGDTRTLIGNFYLVSSHLQGDGPAPQPTNDLPSAGPGTPDQVILPSSSLSDWGANLKLPVPGAELEYSGRIVISVGAPAQCQVVKADHSVAAPTASNAADPSTGTIYDFLEFTMSPGSAATNSVDVDTSQVDSFGVGLSLQLNQTTGSGAGPVGIQQDRSGVFSDFQTFVAGADAAAFAACACAAPRRLIAPKAVLESNPKPKADDPLVTYFDATIDAFFVQYFCGPVSDSIQGGGQTFSIVSDADHKTYTGSVVKIGEDGNTNVVLRLQTAGSAVNYDIYYPFFTTNSSLSTPVFGAQPVPSFFDPAHATELPSRMVFACDGVFADNGRQAAASKDIDSAVLGDLENSISAALHRGVALHAPSSWGQRETWFPPGGVYNYWVQFWHQPGRSIGDLAYAFPYDDKFGKSTNLQQSQVASVSVELASWGSLTLPQVALMFPLGPQLRQNGPISASVTVTGEGGVPTGTVGFFIDGVQFAKVSLESGQALLPDGTMLPALPDGGSAHTYTLTAVYSGDRSFLPNLAVTSLGLVR